MEQETAPSSANLPDGSLVPEHHVEAEEPTLQSVDLVEVGGLNAWCVVVLNLVLLFLFSGTIFGWAPLQLLLEDEGIYGDMCSATEASTCESRADRFLFLYSLGSTAAVLSASPSGFLIDRLGPAPCCVLSAVLETGGILLLGLSNDKGFDAFGVGCVMVGAGGTLILINAMTSVFIVPMSYMPLVSTWFNILFDASSVTFLALYQFYKRVGLSRDIVFCSYAVLCAILHVALFVAWVSGPTDILMAVQAAEARNARATEEAATQLASADVLGVSRPGEEAPKEGKSVHKSPSVADGRSKSKVCAQPPLHGQPLRQQLWSFEFVFAVVFMITNIFRSNAYLGTIKELLEDLGDGEKDYLYTQVFALSLPASILFAPLISVCLRRRGFGDSFLLTSVLGLAWNGIALVEHLPLQVLAFVAFTNFRACLYAVYFTYMVHTFGSRTSSTAIGIVGFAASGMNFAIWPIATLLTSTWGLWSLYVLMLLLAVPGSAMSLSLRRRLKAQPASDCRVREVL